MSDIVAFLTARLDEDEAAARAAAAEDVDVEDLEHWRYGDYYSLAGTPTGAHIARHTPPRVLADIEAKRAVLRQYRDVQSWCWPVDVRHPMEVLHETLRTLAAVYRDHPTTTPSGAEHE